jgi:SSS family solute:Na+ symporter
MTNSQNILTFLDWVIIAVYFVFVIFIGVRFGKRQKSSENYFLGKRNFPGWAVGISMFATIISSWAFIALPGKAFKNDLQYLMVISTIPISVVITTRFLIPLFREKVGLSAYEYLEKRFGFPARVYGNLAFIIVHFGKMGAILYLLCLAIAGMTGWNVFILIAIVGLTTIVYTFFGGIEGVIWTDVIQGLLLIGGGIVSLFFLLYFTPNDSGEIFSTAFNAGKFKLITLEFSWQKLNVYLLIFFGFNFYLQKFVSDQTVVQRYLLSPSKKQAAKSLWLSTVLLSAVWIIFMTIGALLWSYYELNPALLPESIRTKPDQVFAYFIASELPAGLTGLILAGLIAATMSTLSSDLNSLASVLLEDYYKRWKKTRSELENLFLSRLTVLITGILSIMLAMAMTQIQSMADAAFHFVSIVAGGVMGMYFLGMMTRRTSPGALYVGLGISLIVILWIYLTNSYLTVIPDWVPVININTLWLGLISNILVFSIGLIASLILKRQFRADYDLTIYSKTV